MNLPNNSGWQIVTVVTTVAAVAGLALWLVFRRRPSADEIERARRRFLVQSGRLVDGMLLDVYDVEGADGRTLTFLLFSYRIAGVDYECSQEITAMRDVVEAAEVRAGFPCTVRYQPGNPYNSIVVAEGWTGLRAGLPQFPSTDDPNPLDTSHLEPGER
ncbi:MAG: hypothetical protein ABR957_16610 [Terracidiphilus sp.]|jgi:hypothetical protein